MLKIIEEKPLGCTIFFLCVHISNQPTKSTRLEISWQQETSYISSRKCLMNLVTFFKGAFKRNNFFSKLFETITISKFNYLVLSGKLKGHFKFQIFLQLIFLKFCTNHISYHGRNFRTGNPNKYYFM